MVIVGASVSGCIAAKHAAKAGLEVAVLEEHEEPGKQRKCTGLVSEAGLGTLGVRHRSAVLHTVKGALIHSPNSTLEVRASESKACVLDRQEFDQRCCLEAEDAGARILLGRPAIGFGKYSIRTPKGAVEARAIIGADGVSSWVARENGFPAIPAGRHALCWEAEFENAKVDDESIVQVFLDREKFPGFFAWLVPTGGGARVGLGTTAHGKLKAGKAALLGNEMVREAVGKGRKAREFSALIPLSVRGNTQLGTTLLVGDAAGQVKATTGGGIVFGGLCARLAGESAARHLLDGEGLCYEKEWRGRFGGTLRWHSRVRGLIDSLGNARLDFAIGSLSALGFGGLLARFGDMDRIVKL